MPSIASRRSAKPKKVTHPALTLEFKSISLVIDGKDQIWLHDADSKSLIVFDANLNEVVRFEGKSISLCKIVQLMLDYQDDLVVSEDKSKCLWYRGQGNFMVIDMMNMKVIREIKEFSSKPKNNFRPNCDSEVGSIKRLGLVRDTRDWRK